MKTLLLFALAAALPCGSISSPDCFNLCETYRGAISEAKFTSKKDCRETCTALHQRLASENAINRCEPTAAGGMDLCNQYCNQNFGD